MNKVSVIVPCFNVENYIDQCLQSIFCQELPDIEIICVEDCSTDRTAEILHKYEALGKIKIIQHPRNKGLGAARNTGIASSQGKYLFFLDSDDLMTCNALTHLYNLAELHSLDVVSSQHIPFDENNTYKPSTTFNGFEGVYSFYDFRYEILGRIPVAAWGRLYKKEFFSEKVKSFPEGVLYEDFIPFLKFQTSYGKLYMSQFATVMYRQRKDSIMKSKIVIHHIDAYISESRAMLEEKFPNSWREYLLCIIGNTYTWYPETRELKLFYRELLERFNVNKKEIMRSMASTRVLKIKGIKPTKYERLKIKYYKNIKKITY